jgi:hypothetical protein
VKVKEAMTPHNETLTDITELRIPIICQEECAEVIQAISKIFRFGLNHTNPTNNKTNKAHLEEELGQLDYVMDKLILFYNLDVYNIADHRATKSQTFNMWKGQYDK